MTTAADGCHTGPVGTATGLEYANSKMVLVRDGLGTRNELSYDVNGKASRIRYASADEGASARRLDSEQRQSRRRLADRAQTYRHSMIGLRSFSSASTDTATTTVSIRAPAVRVADDVLVASFIADLDPIAAVPSGRTSIVNALGINSFGTSGARMFAYYRVVGASDAANYTWTLSKAVK